MVIKSIYDISITLGDESTVYPGDPEFSREVISRIDKGYELSRLTMSAHSGTHIDAPAHFFKGGKSIDAYTAREFIMPALVLDIKGPGPIIPGDLKGAKINKGDAVLFRTANSTSGLAVNKQFSDNYVSLSPKAARVLIKKYVSLVGIDYLSVDAYGADKEPSHKALLGAGALILECINLAYVPAGRYTLICLPLKMKSEASPVRAILIGD